MGHLRTQFFHETDLVCMRQADYRRGYPYDVPWQTPVIRREYNCNHIDTILIISDKGHHSFCLADSKLFCTRIARKAFRQRRHFPAAYAQRLPW